VAQFSGRGIGDLGLPPGVHLALQRFEVPLNPVHADRERVNQIEALGMLGQNRAEDIRASLVRRPEDSSTFLSILSIKCGNWFYWADRAESKESPLFMRI